MRQCVRCGKKGLFIWLSKKGHCKKCARELYEERLRRQAMETQISQMEISAHLPAADYITMRQKESDVIEGVYDLSTVEGIMAIPVPEVNPPMKGACGITGQTEYYLLTKATQYKKEGRTELALACYRKANQLMPLSSWNYQHETYMRLPRYLRQLRRFDEAREAEQEIEVVLSKIEEGLAGNTPDSRTDLRLDVSDLVEVSWVSGCCEVCGKYRGRIFSLGGKDSRFPRLPDNFHAECGLSFSPFYFGVSKPQYAKSDGEALIAEMNRPFFDTRTEEDIASYEQILRHRNELQASEMRRAEYDWLWEYLPEICPKSLAAYSRMKATCKKSYQRLMIEAAKLGKELS